jgi:DNA mismatch repair protein MutS
MAGATPMMAQFEAVKSQNPGCLVFFRLGDFYELFGEDAREASRLLGLTLTARSSGEGRSVKVPMAGVPVHAAPGYLQKLIKAGRKVAICDQVEDPRLAKGLVRRELVRIVTPGTVLEENLVEGGANNYLLSLCLGKSGIGLAYADNSTGEFRAAQLAVDDWAGLEGEVERLRPAECLVREGDTALAERLPRLKPEWTDPFAFSPAESERVLKDHFGVATLEGFGLKEGSEAALSAGALLAYLRRTQKSRLSHLTALSTYNPSSFMRLDAATLRHLELVANQEDGSIRGTLAEVLDHTRTPAGSRLLKRWLAAPLLDAGAIRQRLEAVRELGEGGLLRSALQERLGQCADLERIVSRVGCQTAQARDLAGLRNTLRILPDLFRLVSGCRASSLKSMAAGSLFSELREELDRCLVEEPPLSLKEGGLIAQGYSAELDRLVEDSQGAKGSIAAIQARERERTGIASLKVQFNSVFGYYLEISRSNLDRVPTDYERKQTLVNAERFTTPELKALEERVLHAEERRSALEYELFLALRDKVAASSADLLELAARLSTADALASFAEAAAAENYVCPEITEDEVLDIREGRHPVVEFLGRQQGRPPFVPNDVFLDTASRQILLLTGPNMAGKSTYMRQAALAVLMAQAGSFVPAASARIGLVDRVFTRVGASDRLSRGMSTFLVEMTETANILRHATRRSLVVLDEIGRGTSTYDGVSIAWAVGEHLHESPQLGCRTLFATHYFELTELADRFPRFQNWNISVRESQGKIVFLHRMVPGSSEHSYGIAVARLAGVPEPVIQRAREVLAGLEQEHQGTARGAAVAAPQKKISPLEEELGGLDLDQCTPMQALQTLQRWQKGLEER